MRVFGTWATSRGFRNDVHHILIIDSSSAGTRPGIISLNISETTQVISNSNLLRVGFINLYLYMNTYVDSCLKHNVLIVSLTYLYIPQDFVNLYSVQFSMTYQLFSHPYFSNTSRIYSISVLQCLLHHTKQSKTHPDPSSASSIIYTVFSSSRSTLRTRKCASSQSPNHAHTQDQDTTAQYPWFSSHHQGPYTYFPTNPHLHIHNDQTNTTDGSQLPGAYLTDLERHYLATSDLSTVHDSEATPDTVVSKNAAKLSGISCSSGIYGVQSRFI